MVPLRVALGLTAIAVFLLSLTLSNNTEPWPDGVTTTGRVVYVQERWLKSGGSARVSYEVGEARFERWLPDFADQGPVEVGDPYLLEYRAEDPLEARGVAANRDDAEFRRVTSWSAMAAGILALVAVLLHWLWRDQPTSSSRAPQPRRSR